MSPDDLQSLRSAVRDVPDFPKPGIMFKDITPVLLDPELFRRAIAGLVEVVQRLHVQKVVGIDARGFIFGGAVAHAMGLGFVPIRKKGKLPWQCRSVSYSLEYGEAVVEVHQDAVKPGERVAIIDDLLATGGTARAALELIRQLGGDPVAAIFLIELSFLGGRETLKPASTESLLIY